MRPGWICCRCRHYNGKKKLTCFKCVHTCCTEIVLPPLPKRERVKHAFKSSSVLRSKRAAGV